MARRYQRVHYELTREPWSLVKDGLMWKPTKSTLRIHLTANVVTPKTPSKHVVIDDGAFNGSVVPEFVIA